MNGLNNSLQSRLYAKLEQNPQRRAITFYDQGNFEWRTFEQFYNQAMGYAVGLRENGLQPGGVCLIVHPSGEFSATMILATLLCGAVPLLTAPPALQKEQTLSSLKEILLRIIGKAKPQIVILPESLKVMEGEFAHKRRSVCFLIGQNNVPFIPSASISPILPDENDLAAMQLTSGTTGFPRICQWKQRNVLAALNGMMDAMQLNQEDICLNWTPLYHDMGLVNNFLLCLTNGIPLVMIDPLAFVKKPALWLQGLSDTSATTTWSPNFGFAITAQRVRDSELEGIRLDKVRGFWNAAERIHYETIKSFHSRFASLGVRLESLKTNFGCAENVGGATFSDPNGLFKVEHIDPLVLHQKKIAKPIANPNHDTQVMSVVGAGKPVPGMKIKILSRTKKALPDGYIGEIALETPSRMMGYLGDAPATRRAIYQSLLRTGDLGYLRDGELFWVGRARERITIRGKKLDPSDFEPILLRIPDLREGCFAAFGVDDQTHGTQQIIIVSEVRNNVTSRPEDISAEIRNEVFLRLGVNVQEVLLVRSGTLAKTSSGKRRHRYFQQLYAQGKLQEFAWNGSSAKADPDQISGNK